MDFSSYMFNLILQSAVKIDRVEDLNIIMTDMLQRPSAFYNDTALRICYHIGTMHLQQVRLQPKPGLAGA